MKQYYINSYIIWVRLSIMMMIAPKSHHKRLGTVGIAIGPASWHADD